MSKIDVKKSLSRWGKDVKKKIEQRIIETDTIDTGNLLRSIEFDSPRYSGGSGTWFVDFSMLDYGKYTDLRNPRVKKLPIPPRNFFFKLIEDEADNLEDYLFDEIYLDIEKKLKPKK